MAKKQKSKAPLKRRYANDFTVTETAEDGTEQTYYPHYGEYIDFVPTPTIEEYAFQQRKLADRTHEGVSEWMASRIMAWTWTDAIGRPLPQPSAEVIRRLNLHELLWLQGALMGTVGQERDEDPLVGSSDSTGGSTTIQSGPENPQPSDE